MSQLKTGGLVLVILLALGIAWLGSRRKGKAGAALETQRAQLEVLRQQSELELAERRALDARESAIAELEAGSSTPAPDEDAERVDRVRGEIGDLVESQPEEVAALLRGWLADRRS
jgi:flagellar M-ring protein FliF